MSTKRSSPKRPFLLRWYVLTPLVLLCVVGIYFGATSIQPSYDIPPDPAPPVPNARDTFSLAESKIKDRDSIDYALANRPMPAEKGDDTSFAYGEFHHYTPAEEAYIVNENKPTLDLLRKGFGQQYLAPPYRAWDSVYRSTPPDRNLSRLIALEAVAQRQSGEDAKSVNSSIDDVQFGVKLTYGVDLGDGLNFSGCAKYGLRQAEVVVDKLTSDQAKQAARHLAEIDASLPPFSDEMVEDQRGTQHWLKQLFHLGYRKWRYAVGILLLQADYDDLKSIYIGLATLSPKQFYDTYTQYTDARIAISKLPWPQQLTAHYPAEPSNPAYTVLIGDSVYPEVRELTTTARIRELETALALRAFYVDHDAYPDNLAELSPKYLLYLPIDPSPTISR